MGDQGHCTCTPALSSIGSFSSKFQFFVCEMGGTPSRGQRELTCRVDAERGGCSPHLLRLFSASFVGPLNPVFVVLAALMAVRPEHGDGQGGRVSDQAALQNYLGSVS